MGVCLPQMVATVPAQVDHLIFLPVLVVTEFRLIPLVETVEI